MVTEVVACVYSVCVLPVVVRHCDSSPEVISLTSHTVTAKQRLYVFAGSLSRLLSVSIETNDQVEKRN